MNPNMNLNTIDLFEKAINDVWIAEVYHDTSIMPSIKRYPESQDGCYLAFKYTIFADYSMTVKDISKNPETLKFLHLHEDYVKNLLGLDFFDLANFDMRLASKSAIPETNVIDIEFLYYLTKEKVELIKFLFKLKGYEVYPSDYVFTSSMLENCTNLKTVNFSSLSV